MRAYAQRKTTDLIVVHATMTPPRSDLHVKDLDRLHRSRGSIGIGFHYLVTLDGTVEVGRPEDRIGVHLAGHNDRSIGIAFVGGPTPKPAQRVALLTLLQELLDRHRGAIAVTPDLQPYEITL